jgi:5-methylcytosine-specific restriction endonuclease McrA
MEQTAKQKRAEYMRKYYHANKEKALALVHRYQKENAELISRKHKEWREKNKESNLANKRAYYAANKEKANAAVRAWVENNRERHKENCKKNYAAKRGDYIARARKRQKNLIGTFTQSDIDALYATQAAKCAGCKCCIKQKYEIDHVMPVSKGGPNTADNLQLLCVSCNRKKRAMLPEEWAALIGKLFV